MRNQRLPQFLGRRSVFDRSAIQATQRHLRRMITAHSMHATAGRSRRRTNIDIFRGSRVAPPSRPKQKLPQVQRAAINIAADEVRVDSLQLRRRKSTPRQHAIAKSWCEPLDLHFDFFQHVDIATIWHMAIRPSDVLPLWRARSIK